MLHKVPIKLHLVRGDTASGTIIKALCGFDLNQFVPRDEDYVFIYEKFNLLKTVYSEKDYYLCEKCDELLIILQLNYLAK